MTRTFGGMEDHQRSNKSYKSGRFSTNCSLTGFKKIGLMKQNY